MNGMLFIILEMHAFHMQCIMHCSIICKQQAGCLLEAETSCSCFESATAELGREIVAGHPLSEPDGCVFRETAQHGDINFGYFNKLVCARAPLS